MSPLTRTSLAALLLLAPAIACSTTEDDKSPGGGDGDSGSSGDGDSVSLGDGDGDIGGDGDGDGDLSLGDGDVGDGDGPVCESYQAESERVEPLVMFLLDQSASMDATRWAHATEALTTASANLEGIAQVGFIGFPTHPISSDSVWSETCAAEVKVAAGPGTAASIASSIHPTGPTSGHTPVRAALELAGTELAKPEYATLAKYVVLITDGQPNCANMTPGSFWMKEDPSDAVTALSAQGVTTFVVGYQLGTTEVDGFVPADTANAMALAGGTEAYRDVANGVELAAELEDIRRLVVPCDFELNEPPRGGADYVRVTIDETEFELEVHWTLENQTTVVMTEGGAACNLLRDGGNHTVQIDVECEPVKVR